MMQVHVAYEFAVRSRRGAALPAEGLHAEAARLMDALLDLEKCNEDITDSTASPRSYWSRRPTSPTPSPSS
jgi:hypothetical protein